MTLKRTIRRREQRQRAALRKQRPVDPRIAHLNAIMRDIYESAVLAAFRRASEPVQPTDDYYVTYKPR